MVFIHPRWLFGISSTNSINGWIVNISLFGLPNCQQFFTTRIGSDRLQFSGYVLEQMQDWGMAWLISGSTKTELQIILPGTFLSWLFFSIPTWSLAKPLEKLPSQKDKVLFQSSFFRGELLNFRKVWSYNIETLTLKGLKSSAFYFDWIVHLSIRWALSFSPAVYY